MVHGPPDHVRSTHSPLLPCIAYMEDPSRHPPQWGTPNHGARPPTLSPPPAVSLWMRNQLLSFSTRHSSNSGKLILHQCQHLGKIHSSGLQNLGQVHCLKCPKFPFDNICVLKKHNLKTRNHILFLVFVAMFYFNIWMLLSCCLVRHN